MFLSLWQAAPINFDINVVPEGGYIQPPIPDEILPAMIGILIFGTIAMIILIIIAIVNLINIYHWGMTNQSEFQKIGQDKKKWYLKLIIVPIAFSLINFIPGLGQLASLILVAYWIFVVLQYFFKVKNKIPLNSASSEKPIDSPSSPANS